MLIAVNVEPQLRPAGLGNGALAGLQFADPAEQLVVMAPPEANYQGGAELEHPLLIPPGRGGFQPKLALTYDSAGGNGWVGTGWDLTVGEISVDTRWGVPRFDPLKESETYQLDGQVLNPTAVRAEWQARVPERSDFTRRVETEYELIIRHGTNPKDYWWEVRDKMGGIRWYGGYLDDGGGSKPMRVFSDEDAEFLAPLLAQGLLQAKPEQIVGFKVSPSAGSGTEPTAGTLYMHKGSIYLTIAPSQNRKASGFIPSSAAHLEKPPTFVALGSGAMTMVIDYQALAKGPIPTSPTVAGVSKPMPVSASQAAPIAPVAMPAPSTSTVKIAPPQEDSLLDPQEFHVRSRSQSGTPELAAEDLLNRKLDELRDEREANKLKDSEIAMLKKEAAWMKQELRQRTDEVKAMKARKTAARPAPKKKSAEAHPTR